PDYNQTIRRAVRQPEGLKSAMAKLVDSRCSASFYYLVSLINHGSFVYFSGAYRSRCRRMENDFSGKKYPPVGYEKSNLLQTLLTLNVEVVFSDLLEWHCLG